MRIIGGRFKGHRFYPPANKWPTRPTTDFAKEGLFNILMNRLDFDETVMLDLFGGTGNHCYEFISRGCCDVCYVDKFGPAVQFVHRISKELEVENCIQIVKMDVFAFLKSTSRKFNYVFAGPPYPLPNLDDIPDKLFETNVLIEGGLFVLEHNPNHDFTGHARFSNVRNYGSTIFSFFE